MDKMTRVKMMTATILLVVATVVCGQRQKARPQQDANWTDSVAAYRQLARQGDKEARLKLVYQNVDEDGSVLELTMACVVAIEEGNCEWAMNTLHRLTKTSPVVWSMLAMLYRCESQVRNDSLTKVCLAKADEYALLSDYDQKKLDGE